MASSSELAYLSPYSLGACGFVVCCIICWWFCCLNLSNTFILLLYCFPFYHIIIVVPVMVLVLAFSHFPVFWYSRGPRCSRTPILPRRDPKTPPVPPGPGGVVCVCSGAVWGPLLGCWVPGLIVLVVLLLVLFNILVLL